MGAVALFSGVFLASADTVINFQVDMSTATFDPATQTVAARGAFNGWNGFSLTNNPTGPNPSLWTGSTNVPLNNMPIDYKYSIEPGATYESSHNRLIRLPTAVGSTITAPSVYFNDAPSTPLAATITFQVNLAQQINTGAFVPGTSSAYARGGYNGWATDFAMTNDPSILTTNQYGLVSSNVYVYTYAISASQGQTIDYKFYIDTGVNWESPGAGVGDPDDSNNRWLNVDPSGTQTTPIVYFSDAVYAPVATNNVTFQVDMTSQYLDGTFDPTTGPVELRGNFNSWGGTQIVCTNDPANTNIFLTTVQLVDGIGAVQQYKFWAFGETVNGGWETMANNRALSITAASNRVLNPVNFSDEIPSLGSLVVSPPSAGTVLVSWTGKPGAPNEFLQTSLDPTKGVWQDHPETVGLTSTNFPISAGQAVYFRLKGQ